MNLYYGTSFENAKAILENRIIKGRKTYNRHNNRYVLFSKDKVEARQLGEVVIQLKDVPNVVSLSDLDNEEMLEFANKSIGEKAVKKAMVLLNKHKLNDESVSIYLSHEDKKEMERMKQELLAIMKPEDKVVKSPKLYNDFLAVSKK